MEIPDDLLCLFSGRVERRGETPSIEVPVEEFDRGDLEAGTVYRIAVLAGPSGERGADEAAGDGPAREPPVAEGDRRRVEIEGIGDQGDGIAKVDRGYVVIVPGTDVGDQVTIAIESIYPNFAMATVVEPVPGPDPDGDARDESTVEPDDPGGSSQSPLGYGPGAGDR